MPTYQIPLRPHYEMTVLCSAAFLNLPTHVQRVSGTDVRARCCGQEGVSAMKDAEQQAWRRLQVRFWPRFNGGVHFWL